jgi:hypothetical protein
MLNIGQQVIPKLGTNVPTDYYALLSEEIAAMSDSICQARSSVAIFLTFSLAVITPNRTLGAVRPSKSANVHSGHSHSQTSPDASVEIERLERLSWVAWKNHDADFFRQFLTAEHVEVGTGGSTTKDAVVAGVADRSCTVRSYVIDHFSFTRLSVTMAVLTYRAQQDTLCNGVAVPSPVWATSVYVYRHNRWANAVYVHTPIPTAK